MAWDRYQLEGFIEHYDQCLVSVGEKIYFISGGVADRRTKNASAYEITDKGLQGQTLIPMEEVKPLDLFSGFYQIGGSPILLSRSPERSVKRGMCSQNTIAGVVSEANIPISVETLNLNINLWTEIVKAKLTPRQFSSDDWTAVNRSIRGGSSTGLALSTEFAVVRRHGRDGPLPTLITPGGPIGRITPAKEIVIHPKLSYLKENLDACIASSFKKGEAPNVSIG